MLCDNPLVFTAGIDAPGLMVSMPLSPTAAFIAVRSDELVRLLKNADPDEIVRRLNESIVDQAKGRVYARTNKPRRFIENRLRMKAVVKPSSG